MFATDGHDEWPYLRSEDFKLLLENWHFRVSYEMKSIVFQKKHRSEKNKEYFIVEMTKRGVKTALCSTHYRKQLSF